MARLYPLFSGSSGNSYYIGSAEAGVLIDAGRSAKPVSYTHLDVYKRQVLLSGGKAGCDVVEVGKETQNGKSDDL